jgi:tetratricopeptide (TPR) repeat protein
MVNAFRFACVLALICIPALNAKELADYKIGDVAAEEITTPVALDVIDPAATAARRAEEALTTPAIFRKYSAVTNEIAAGFTAQFAVTRSNFFAAWKYNSKLLALGDKPDTAPDLSRFIADFNRTNKTFPVTPGLARLWAGGDAGLAIQNIWLGRLLETYRHPIRPDELPAGFVLGDMARLVPVSRPQDNLTLEEAERSGRITVTTSMGTLTRERGLLQKSFPADEQAAGRALAGLLKADCTLDENLTQQVRARQSAQIAVAVHFDAGQIVVRRGTVIDAKIKNALDQIVRQTAAENAQAQAQREHDQAVAARNLALKAYTHNEWLLGAVVILAIATLLAFWRLSVQHRRPAPMPSPRALALPQPSIAPAAPPDIAPHVAQVVKDALFQELTALRIELNNVRQQPVAEAVEVVSPADAQRLLQERLRDYEMRIHKLEAQQAARPAPAPSPQPAAREHKNGDTLPPGDREKCIASLLSNGQSLLNMNDMESALKCFDLALTLQPEHGETLIKKGGALEKAGRLDEAIACYDRAIATDDSMTVAYLHKGGLFNRLARYEEAMQCYERALRSHGKTAA